MFLSEISALLGTATGQLWRKISFENKLLFFKMSCEQNTLLDKKVEKKADWKGRGGNDATLGPTDSARIYSRIQKVGCRTETVFLLRPNFDQLCLAKLGNIQPITNSKSCDVIWWRHKKRFFVKISKTSSWSESGCS